MLCDLACLSCHPLISTRNNERGETGRRTLHLAHTLRVPTSYAGGSTASPPVLHLRPIILQPPSVLAVVTSNFGCLRDAMLVVQLQWQKRRLGIVLNSCVEQVHLRKERVRPLSAGFSWRREGILTVSAGISTVRIL